MIDGVDTQFVTKVPSDEKNTLDVGFQFESPLPFQIEIHEWNGRSKGFKAFVYIKLNDGRIYSRNRDSDGNDSGWFEYQILQWL